MPEEGLGWEGPRRRLRSAGRVSDSLRPLLSTWNIGLSLGGPGFSATLQRNPNTNVEAVLLRLLDLPRELYERTDTRSLIVFDEIQDILAIEGADGQIRSVIQHHLEAASYAFAGSAPATMERLFADPRRPLLEQAVPKSLPPLPGEEVRDYVLERFERTGRDAGDALASDSDPASDAPVYATSTSTRIHDGSLPRIRVFLTRVVLDTGSV